jgi:hypothetical protein
MGKGKVVSINGEWCEVYWDHMGIVQKHSVEQIVHEAMLEQKNKERLDKRKTKR